MVNRLKAIAYAAEALREPTKSMNAANGSIVKFGARTKPMFREPNALLQPARHFCLDASPPWDRSGRDVRS